MKQYDIVAVIALFVLCFLQGCDAPPDWSPKGGMFAFLNVEGDKHNYQCKIYLYDTSNNSRSVIAVSELLLGVPAWSPNGERIAFLQVLPGANKGETGGYRLSIMIYDVKGKTIAEAASVFKVNQQMVPDFRKAVQEGTLVVACLRLVQYPLLWHPDGDNVVYSLGFGSRSPSDDIQMINVATGKTIGLAHGEPWGWSKDGKAFAYIAHRLDTKEEYLSLVDDKGLKDRVLVKSRDLTSPLSASMYVINDVRYGWPRWSESGKELLFAGADRLAFVDIASGRIRTPFEDFVVCSPVWVPNKNVIVYFKIIEQRERPYEGNECCLVVKDLKNANDNIIYKYIEKNRYVGYGMSLSPDGKWLTFVHPRDAGKMPRKETSIILLSIEGNMERVIMFP